MVTWTTYGSWLPGDKRGYVRRGKILDGNELLLEKNRKRRKSDLVRLNKTEKQVVKDTIIKEARRTGQIIEGVSVYSNHVHLLLRTGSESIEKSVSRYKSITTRTLWKNGRDGRIWTRGFHKSFCFDEKMLNIKKDYIAKHKD